MKKRISLIIPAYNEAEGLSSFLSKVYTHLQTLAQYDREILVIDDGSTDTTWEVIQGHAHQYATLKGVNLSRNFGKERALSAGLHYAQGDAAITIDADGQHPIERLGDFLHERESGYDIVYNRRPAIQGASFLKTITSKLFYLVFNKIAEFKLESQTTDYRLLDRKVINVFLQFTEKNRIYRGLIDRIGFTKKALVFDALPNSATRKASYSWSKLTKLAIDSITGFSVRPLRVVGYLGSLIIIFSCLMLCVMVIDKFSGNRFGFSNLGVVVMINTLLVGIVMVSLGFIAMYIAQIHEEVKGRPLFVVKETRNIS